MTTSEDTIRICLRDCTVRLFVGVHDYEKLQPQPVVIRIEATARLARRYDDLRAGDIASVIDYDPWYRFITDTLPTLGHIPLLESVAERIIDLCFKDARIEEVWIKLEKPDIFKDKAVVGIEMRRTRKAA